MALEELRSKFINVFNTQELIETLSEKLPFDDFKIENVQGSIKQFKASVKCQVTDAQNFISQYNAKAQETLRLSKTRELAKNVCYEKYVYLRCHHNTRHHGTMNANEVKRKTPSKRFKNTDCPFSLVLRFLRTSCDVVSDFNCILDLEWTHNHPTQSLQALSFKDVAKSTQDEIYKLFEKGFTPGLAYREFWRLAKESCSTETELHKFTADRAVFPRRTDYNHFYTEYHNSKYGSKDIHAMFVALESMFDLI